jgi:hypothetical protein
MAIRLLIVGLGSLVAILGLQEFLYFADAQARACLCLIKLDPARFDMA